MSDVGRVLMTLGLLLFLAGLAFWGLGRWGFRGLPGDLRFETEHVRVYIPLATSLLISGILTGIFWIWSWFTRR
ncbi:MAG: DUF2905 domain-containing protein [Gemmatimonadota bacterium]